MSMEHCCNYNEKKTHTIRGKTLYQIYCVHQKFQMQWRGIEPRPTEPQPWRRREMKQRNNRYELSSEAMYLNFPFSCL